MGELGTAVSPVAAGHGEGCRASMRANKGLICADLESLYPIQTARTAARVRRARRASGAGLRALLRTCDERPPIARPARSRTGLDLELPFLACSSLVVSPQAVLQD